MKAGLALRDEEDLAGMDDPAVEAVELLNDRNCGSRVDPGRAVLAGYCPKGFPRADYMLDSQYRSVGVGGTVDKEEDQ